MEQRVSLITLGVADLDRSLAFYGALGWRKGNPQKEVAFFQAGGMIVALWSRKSLAEDARIVDDGKTSFGGMSVAYNCRSMEEVDAVLAEAEAAGGRIPKPAEKVSWGGYSGYFADPDGHLWEIAWNPGWTIHEDGSVSLGP